MTAKASIARTKAMATSSTPHHLGQVSLSVTKPATTGNTDEMQNTIAVAIASGRLQCGSAALVWRAGAAAGGGGGRPRRIAHPLLTVGGGFPHSPPPAHF